MLQRDGVSCGTEIFVTNGYQTLTISLFTDYEPGDLLGTPSSPVIAISTWALQDITTEPLPTSFKPAVSVKSSTGLGGLVPPASNRFDPILTKATTISATSAATDRVWTLWIQPRSLDHSWPPSPPLTSMPDRVTNFDSAPTLLKALPRRASRQNRLSTGRSPHPGGIPLRRSSRPPLYTRPRYRRGTAL